MAALTYAFNAENGETPQTLVERRRSNINKIRRYNPATGNLE